MGNFGRERPKLGSVEVNKVIKVGGIQNTQVLGQAVFLAALPLASGGSAAKTLFHTRHTAG